MDAGRPGTVAEPPRCRDRHPDQPRVPPNDDHPGQRPGVLALPGIEGAQARDEEIRIPAQVRVMHPDEFPAAAPDFASLAFVYLWDDGHLCASAESE
jgi:hypothetical protein